MNCSTAGPACLLPENANTMLFIRDAPDIRPLYIWPNIGSGKPDIRLSKRSDIRQNTQLRLYKQRQETFLYCKTQMCSCLGEHSNTEHRMDSLVSLQFTFCYILLEPAWSGGTVWPRGKQWTPGTNLNVCTAELASQFTDLPFQPVSQRSLE